MKRTIVVLGVTLLMAGASARAFDPARTRYDTSQAGKWSVTLALGSSADTTLDVSWEICKAGATILSGTALIQPTFDTSRVIADNDPTGYYTGRPLAPTRAGQPLQYWDPDSLFAGTNRNRWDFCCGDARGIRVKTYGVPAVIRLWLSGRCH